MPVPFLPRSPILSFLVILTDKSLRILFDDLGSINYVSKDLLSIGRERTKKINSPNFKYEYPIKVGFLGRICLEKGLIIIKKLFTLLISKTSVN